LIALCSIFRNSEGYLDTYFGQVKDLRNELDVTLVLGEGDSTDRTQELLHAYLSTDDTLLHLPHGGPHFGSVDNPQRWEQIAQVVAPVIAEAITRKPKALVWVESDLIWDTGVMVKLIQTALGGRTVAPMVFAGNTDRFYDTWGFRMGRKQFLPYEPYMPEEGIRDNGYVKLDSCGSCFATSDLPDLAKWSGHWPFHSNKWGSLWLDPTICVRHP
jgi:hypothetical protein